MKRKKASNIKASKPQPGRSRRLPRQTAKDDSEITALALQRGKLSPAMEAYFAKCQEKLGFVPNVLKAYAFDNAKLEAFVGHVQRPDAGAVGPVQARARDDRGRGVVA